MDMEKQTTFEFVCRFIAHQGRPCVDERGWPAAAYGELRSPSGALRPLRLSEYSDIDTCRSAALAAREGHDADLVADLEWAHERWARGGDWAALLAAVAEWHSLVVPPE